MPARMEWISVACLLVGGLLAVSSLAFPFFQGSWTRPPVVDEYYVDSFCRGPAPTPPCGSYAQWEAVVGPNGTAWVQTLEETLALVAALALFGALGAVAVAFRVLLTGRAGVPAGPRRRVDRPTSLIGCVALWAAVVAEPVGVDRAFAFLLPGCSGFCTGAFYTFSGGNGWFPGLGWYLVLAGAVLATLGTILLFLQRRPPRDSAGSPAPSAPREFI